MNLSKTMDKQLVQDIEQFRTQFEIKSTFNQKFTQQIKQKFISQGQLNILKSESWSNLFTPSQCLYIADILPYVRQAKCWQLRLSYNYIPLIIEVMQGQQFARLQKLRLQGNNIVSIERIAFLHMEILEELLLTENLIMNFRPLHKIRWNQLQYLSIGNNFGIGLSFTRIKVNPKFSVLNLDMNYNERTSLNDIGAMTKFQASNMDVFALNDQSRIRQVRVYWVLKKKYLKGEITFD